MAQKRAGLRFKRNCRFFNGYAPCIFHKSDGRNCKKCPDYKGVKRKILIIKLGAIGDVIRTTPLVYKLKARYPDCELSWLTYYSEVLPGTVDIKLKFSLASLLVALATAYDLVINLDKDYEACALTNLISAKIKKGFGLIGGKTAPVNKAAKNKFYTGLDDTLNKRNKKHYIEEIFEICGYKFKNEPYSLDVSAVDNKFLALLKVGGERKVIGLNTGCGGRWKETRLWPDEYWIRLTKLLTKNGYSVVLLGGKDEDKKNRMIQKKSGANYFGFFPMDKFIQLVDSCDLVITQVTMCLHIAIALGKGVVLLNNIFNKKEFYLYGLGTIIEPDVDCLGCFKSNCGIGCMSRISPKQVFSSVTKTILRLNNKNKSKMSFV